jgi:uncharacterized phage protein (TIGR02218 family)
MRSAASGIMTLLERDETNYTFICRITKVNGDIIRLSSCVGDVVIDAETFLGNPGFNLSSITSAAFGQPPTVDMEIPVSTTGPITPDDVIYGAMDHASIDIYMVDYLQPEQGTLNLFRGRISQSEITNAGAASFQMEGFAADLLELVVETYGTTCPASLGDARCQKDLTAYTFSATVATVTSRLQFTLTITAPSAVDGYFANGALQFTSGENDGYAFDIRNWTQATSRVDLWLPTVKEVAPGDTLSIVAGCDKQAETCRVKFSNIINFQGFPFLPTKSQLECGEDDFVDERPPTGTTTTVDC